MTSLFVKINRTLWKFAILFFLAGCVEAPPPLSDPLAIKNPRCESCVYSERELQGGWASVRGVKIFYSEPFLDNYEMFEAAWPKYRGDFGEWFGHYFRKNFEASIAQVSSANADGKEISIEMKDDSFWKSSARTLSRKRPSLADSVVLEGLLLPRERENTDDGSVEIYITPINVFTHKIKESLAVTYKCGVTVLDSKDGSVILYAILESRGSLHGALSQKDAGRTTALGRLVEKMTSLMR